MRLINALEKFLNHLKKQGGGVSHLKTVRWRIGRFMNPPAAPGKERFSLADREVSSVTRVELAEFLEAYKEGHSDGSMAGMTATHRQFWKYCKKKKWLTKNPAKGLKSYSYAPVMRQPPPEGDVLKVAACLPAFVAHRGRHPRDLRDALIVSLSLDCGGRRGAMMRLRRSQVVKALGEGRRAANGRLVYTVMVNRDKTGAAKLEFFEETADLFQQWFVVCPARPRSGGSGGSHLDDSVFVSMWTGRLLHPNTVSKALVRVCRFAGVPSFRPHGVRKRNGREMIKNSDAATAQGYTGHKDIKTLLVHYNAVEQEDVDNAAAEMTTRRRGEGFDVGMQRLFGVSDE